VSAHAVEWLDEQWNDILALRASGVPVEGFTWYSLTDQIDWQHALRVERNDLHPVGLYDLARRPRPVAARYREIVASWSGRLTGSSAAIDPATDRMRAEA
jgi:beta-glucosidase/6-phospho-beta-glucosidase/beta-galactosidase